MKSDLQNKIKSAYESETPFMKDRILYSCARESQEPAYVNQKAEKRHPNTESRSSERQQRSPVFRRVLAFACCLAILALGFVGGYFLPNISKDTPNTHVYFDVNPSLELVLSDDEVIECIAVNEDAKKVINGMDLSGVNLKTALNAIVGSMYVNGYLTLEDNSILISVDKDDTSEILTYITEQVNEVFANSNMECSIIAQKVKADEDLVKRAEEQGVSVGKMHLLDKMVDTVDGITQDNMSELSGMSIKELNLLYQQKRDDDEEEDFREEVFSGEAKTELSSTDALDKVLASLEKTIVDVEEYIVYMVPSKHNRHSVAYMIEIEFIGDDKEYGYEVDCQTGEVVLLYADDTDWYEDWEDDWYEDWNGEWKDEDWQEDHHGNPHEGREDEGDHWGEGDYPEDEYPEDEYLEDDYPEDDYQHGRW